MYEFVELQDIDRIGPGVPLDLEPDDEVGVDESRTRQIPFPQLAHHLELYAPPVFAEDQVGDGWNLVPATVSDED